MYYKLGIELVFPNVAPKNGPLRKRKGFPGGSHGKESACNAGDPDPIPGSGRSPGEGTDIHSVLKRPTQMEACYVCFNSDS